MKRMKEEKKKQYTIDFVLCWVDPANEPWQTEKAVTAGVLPCCSGACISSRSVSWPGSISETGMKKKRLAEEIIKPRNMMFPGPLKQETE